MNAKVTRRLLIAAGFAALALSLLPPPKLKAGPLMRGVSEAKRLLTGIHLYALHREQPPATLDSLFAEIGDGPLRQLATNYDFLTPGAVLRELPPGTPVIRRKGQVNGRAILGYAGGQVRAELSARRSQ